MNDGFHRLASILDSGSLAATCHGDVGRTPGAESPLGGFWAYCRQILLRLAGR
jgi:hypothetical protein